jgi:general secretion pathway protein L
MLADAAAASREEERVVLALPSAHLFLREVDLPITDRRKLRELLPLELKGEIALDSEELVFDALPLGGGKVLAAWGKRHELAERIELMTDQRVEPEIVTASLFHWHTLLPEDKDGLIAITDGEALAVYDGGKPWFFRALGQGELGTELARTLLALEIGKGARAEKVLLHGDAARRSADISEGSPLPVVLPVEGEMAAVFGGDAVAARDLAGAYAVVRACALEEPVNFRSGDLAYTAGRKKALKKLRFTMILAAACVILLVAETGLRYFLVERDLASVNNSIRGIYRQIFPNRKKPIDEVAEVRAEIKRLGGGATTGSLLATLKKLSESKGDDITDFYEIELDGDQLRARGDARSIQAVNDFRARTAALFAGAGVGEIKSRPDGSVTFVFQGTVKGGGK